MSKLIVSPLTKRAFQQAVGLDVQKDFPNGVNRKEYQRLIGIVGSTNKELMPVLDALRAFEMNGGSAGLKSDVNAEQMLAIANNPYLAQQAMQKGTVDDSNQPIDERIQKVAKDRMIRQRVEAEVKADNIAKGKVVPEGVIVNPNGTFRPKSNAEARDTVAFDADGTAATTTPVQGYNLF